MTILRDEGDILTFFGLVWRLSRWPIETMLYGEGAWVGWIIPDFAGSEMFDRGLPLKNDSSRFRAGNTWPKAKKPAKQEGFAGEIGMGSRIRFGFLLTAFIQAVASLFYVG